MIASASNTLGVGGFVLVCVIFFTGYFFGLWAGKQESRQAVKELARIHERQRRARMKSHHSFSHERFPR